MKKDILIISDVHIGRADSNIKDLLPLLEKLSFKTLILNGDILDQVAIWKDKGKLYKEEHSQYVSKIRKLLKRKKIKVYYLLGNHEFLFFPLIPFGFLFGVKIRNKLRYENYLIEHGHLIVPYLKIRNLFNSCDKIYKKFHENCITYSLVKNKRLIIGHSHDPKIIKGILYDSGDWVGSNTYLLMDSVNDVKLFG